ncbi:hypothetical protein E0Z10_g9187 [Xylaria hypoxylon]|uniref:Heme oxygenase-like protein n=1 Tax=Xylaria hypoxylon TaxID=37992 RepID=A0A4Z0YHX0_9PEZI|nr:hypothetical protein E0Z10_g9187 [Xylaria hypoxylon]
MIMSSKIGDPIRPLSDSINAATRSVHTKLNKLVIFRLQLALPPQAEDASQYVSGLLHITPIYIAFESLWRAILKLPSPAEAHGSDKDESPGTVYNPVGLRLNDRSNADRRLIVDSRIDELLANIYFEGLQRSQALQQDLVSLTGWSDRTLAEQLNNASKSPILSDFLTHIETSVGNSPHILLAYGWVLYMALFSGGRFIRASLENIYPAFWIPASAQQPTPATLANITVTGVQPLSFFRFNTREGGDDLKREFKKRLLESEHCLTMPEREEVIEEARCIFEYMIQLVGELDDICGTDKEAAEARLLSLRSRDSVVVERERRQHFTEMARKTTTDAAAERTRSWVERAI